MKIFKIVLMFVVIATISAFTINETKGYKVGDVASDFNLKNVDGKMVSLANFKEAKGFIVVFTCNMCPYSVANEDRLNALDKKYSKKGYPVIAINPNDPEVSKGDSFNDMKIRAKEKGFTFPYLFDEGQKVYPMYGATKTPHVYILNKTAGKLIVEYIGAIDDSSRDEINVSERFVEDAVDALLKGDKPAKKYTRAIGCSVKDKRSLK
ncbi:thioredoxin family protein [Tenacibaculum sp. AHE15PA]|uniref:thioredoxin family protein n=1 Tax=Tenacibaculum TaxID=104267 RepID=UPI001C4FA5DD|nr:MULTISPECIES: thioredoxin family protein [Tenacibaculum]QXP74382.1 thioredoxin family protein [Tenacibaculum sp. AHE14PA]QXP75249.1 thioredoxin family protein [Tenacibaculum sp. AHE15PA]